MLLLVIFIFFLLLIIVTTKFKLAIKVKDKKKEAILKVYILHFICIANINFDKLKNIAQKNKLKKKFNDIEKSKNKIIKYMYDELINLKIYLEKADLDINISTSDSAFTAYVVATISTIITLVLKFFEANINLKKCNYKVNPVYIDKPLLKIDFFCIISVDMVHIINTIVKVFKKWRCDFNGRTTSNRRAYGNCHE